MSNRQLTSQEIENANELLHEIRGRLEDLSCGDPELQFAYRRKVYKELIHDERGKPSLRQRIKKLKRKEQNGICPVCGKPLPKKYAVLDRLKASDGYTSENTRLIHQKCDQEIQAERRYS